MAIADINAAGGIKSMGGAQLEALLGDSQTKPEIGAAEVEKMNEAGVHAIQRCFYQSIAVAQMGDPMLPFQPLNQFTPDQCLGLLGGQLL